MTAVKTLSARKKAKRSISLLLCAMLFCLPVFARAAEPFDPELLPQQLAAELNTQYADIADKLTFSAGESGDISVYYNETLIAGLYFSRVRENGEEAENGPVNHVSLLVFVTDADASAIQAYLSIYTVLGGSLRHVLYPDTAAQDCSAAMNNGLKTALGSGADTTMRVHEEDNGAYREIFSFTALSSDMIMLSYQAQIIGLY